MKGPRVVIKQAIQNGLLVDGHAQLQRLTDRNELTHSYDEAKSRLMLTAISSTYVSLLTNLDKWSTSKL